MSIQRWDFGDWIEDGLRENNTGEWVRYVDHIAAIAVKDAEIAALQRRVEELERRPQIVIQPPAPRIGERIPETPVEQNRRRFMYNDEPTPKYNDPTPFRKAPRHD